MNETFSIVHYGDGTIEIVAGNVVERKDTWIGARSSIINQDVLDYIKDNKTTVEYIEAGVGHLRINTTPRLDICKWKKRAEFGEDDLINNECDE
jgi:hypothetical protein